MSSRKVWHVVPQGKMWAVKKKKAGRASSLHKKKSVAVSKATRLAKRNKPSQVKIHKMDGTFQTEYTYGNDPERYRS